MDVVRPALMQAGMVAALGGAQSSDASEAALSDADREPSAAAVASGQPPHMAAPTDPSHEQQMAQMAQLAQALQAWQARQGPATPLSEPGRGQTLLDAAHVAAQLRRQVPGHPRARFGGRPGPAQPHAYGGPRRKTMSRSSVQSGQHGP